MIRSSTGVAPIVGVHGLGPGQSFYRPLAERLGPDQPVLGLWTPPVRAGGGETAGVEAIADSYADALDELVPSGPVTLAGVSSASVVAFELARQLTSRGRSVALLVFFDAVGPDVDEVMPAASDRVAVHLREIRRGPAAYVENRARLARAHVRRGVGVADLRLRRKLGRPVTGESLRRAVVEDNVAMLRSYEFAHYDGRVLVFKGGDDAFTVGLAERGMGWSRVVDPDDLEVAVVPGGHLSMLAEPNVKHLAARLATAHEAAVAAIRSR